MNLIHSPPKMEKRKMIKMHKRSRGGVKSKRLIGLLRVVLDKRKSGAGVPIGVEPAAEVKRQVDYVQPLKSMLSLFQVHCHELIAHVRR